MTYTLDMGEGVVFPMPRKDALRMLRRMETNQISIKRVAREVWPRGTRCYSLGHDCYLILQPQR